MGRVLPTGSRLAEGNEHSAAAAGHMLSPEVPCFALDSHEKQAQFKHYQMVLTCKIKPSK